MLKKSLSILLSSAICISSVAVLSTGYAVKAAAKKTLTMWIMPNSPQPAKDFKEIVAPFEKANNVDIKVTVLDWGSAMTKLDAAATSGQGPDVCQLGTTWVAAITSMGALEPLNSYFPKDTSSKFYPGAWATTGVKGDSKVTAIPWFIDSRTIYYRKDILKKANLDPAKAFATWDTLKATARKINNTVIDGKKVAAMGYPGKNDWNVLHNCASWIWGAGGDIVSENGKKTVINSAASLKGLDFYASFATEGLVPKFALEQNSSQIESGFSDGKFGIIITGPWLDKTLRTPKKDGGSAGTYVSKNYGIALLPAGPKGRYSFFGGSNLTVFKSSKNKKLSVDLVKFLTTQESQQVAYSRASGMLPALKSAMKPYVGSNSTLNTFASLVEYGRSYPSIPAWQQIESIGTTHIGNMWTGISGVNGKYGTKDIKAELDKTAQDMNNALSQIK